MKPGRWSPARNAACLSRITRICGSATSSSVTGWRRCNARFEFKTMPRGYARESAKGPTQRSLRAGELVRHALAEILARGEVHDSIIETHLITVAEVRMSPDLRVATVYILPLGGQDAAVVLAALDRNKRYLRGEVAHR